MSPAACSYTASGACTSSASKPSSYRNNNMGGKPAMVMSSVRLYRAIIVLLLAASLSFSGGTLCRIIWLSKHLEVSSAHQSLGDDDVPTPQYSSDEAALDGQELVSLSVGDEDDDDDDDNATLHLPTGQSLFVDIKNADATLLNSEEMLVSAMTQLLNETKDVLLSYHCHSMTPMGLSCVGVSVKSHVTVHTWPKDGVVFMNLFTATDGLLVPSILPTLNTLFGIPPRLDSSSLDNPSRMLWSYKLRGFRAEFSTEYNIHGNPYEKEIALDYLMHIDYTKTSLVSEQTDFQHVDIYEITKSLEAYEKSLADDGSYESLHRELYRPDTVLFLDGVQQSSWKGEAAYHEALVHPAMIAHPNPKRVAIIGGGEGATLREILKHKTVTEVKMVDIDGRLIELCREYLPEWNDCSDLIGSDSDSCFDDSRASVECMDAFGWFIDNFGEEEMREEKYDVIIMDALDPDDFIAIVGNLYKDNHFVDSLYNGLSDNGVFVVQTGETDQLRTPAFEMGPDVDKGHLFGALQSAGFESMHTYVEGHSYFFAPWSYLVCFKNYESRANWYRSAPELAVELHERLYGTKSGQPTLRYVDESTLIDYQLPSKAQETTYCRGEDKAKECDRVSRKYNSVPSSDLQVRKSPIGDYAGRGLFAAKDIPAHSYLFVQESVHCFYFLPLTWSIMTSMQMWAHAHQLHYVESKLSSVLVFTEGYGFIATMLGKLHYTIDSGIGLFCNHGCNGTYNFGTDDYFMGDVKITEVNVDDMDDDPPDVVFNPIRERHMRQWLSTGDYTLRDIRKGEEILCNYVDYIGDPDDWDNELAELHDQCTGSTIGQIYAYEHEHAAEVRDKMVISEQ